MAMGGYDEAIELIYFAWRELVSEPDRLLARRGLSRVHHRIIYCVARGPGITIGGLCRVLGVSKQALAARSSKSGSRRYNELGSSVHFAPPVRLLRHTGAA